MNLKEISAGRIGNEHQARRLRCRLRRAGFHPTQARARDRRLEAADQRRRQHARQAHPEPRGARAPRCSSSRPTRTARCRCRRTPRSASPTIRGRRVPRIRAFEPDAIHVATEGPLGFWTVGWLRRQGLRFTTSFHTRYAEYLSARAPVPLEWGYQVVRWFHERAEHTLVSSQSLLDELRERRVARQLVHWPRGVDATLFHPRHRQRRASTPSCRGRSGSTSAASPSRRPSRTSSSCRCRAPRSSSATARRASRCSAVPATSCGAATASARISRRTSRAPTASSSRRAPRPSATSCSRRSRRASRSRRCRRPARSTSSKRASTAPSTTICMRACQRAMRCSRERARASIVHRTLEAGPRRLPRAPRAASPDRRAPTTVAGAAGLAAPGGARSSTASRSGQPQQRRPIWMTAARRRRPRRARSRAARTR